MKTKQTAVDYLYSKWLHEGIITIKDYQTAKVMEKEQIIVARQNGVSEAISKGYTMSHEDYYNETYKSE